MTTLFQITLAYDDVNSRYAMAAYNVIEGEGSAYANSLNKVWTEMGKRIKAAEKERKNTPSKNGSEPSRIIIPQG